MTTRRAAIVAPMRTPVGTFGGAFATFPSRTLAATAIKAVLARTGIDPGPHRGCRLRPVVRQRRDPLPRAVGGAAGGSPGQRAGLADRPALRRRTAGDHHRGHDGADRRRGRGAGRRSREHEQRRALHHRGPLGSQVGQPVPVRPAGPGAGTIAARMAVRQDLRDDRDRGEPRRPLRHHQGRGGRLRRAQPPAGRGRLGGRAVRRRGGPGPGPAAARRPGHGQQGRGRAAGLHPRVAEQAAHDHARRHGHGGQRQPAERRRRGVPGRRRGQARGAGPGAARLPGRLGGGRVRARHHGHRAGAGRGQAVRPDRAGLRRDGPGRAERGVRRPGPGACWPGWGWNDPDKLNVNGSGISLGHPIGATGARMLATGLRELRRRDGRYLLETMCVGGGQGVAAVFEAAR